MALNFKKYEGTEFSLVEIGTVASTIPGGSLKFTPNSLAKYQAGQIKAISMLLANKKGESVTTPLSKKVSLTVKNALDNGKTKSDCLKVIAKLLICEDPEDEKVNIICAPKGEGGEEEEIVIDNAVSKSKLAFADLTEF
jgi:hypothetical protein